MKAGKGGSVNGDTEDETRRRLGGRSSRRKAGLREHRRCQFEAPNSVVRMGDVLGRVNKAHKPLRATALGDYLRVWDLTRTRQHNTAVVEGFIGLEAKATSDRSAAFHQEWVQLRIWGVQGRLPSYPSAPNLIVLKLVVHLMQPPRKMKRIARTVLRRRKPEVQQRVAEDKGDRYCKATHSLHG